MEHMKLRDLGGALHDTEAVREQKTAALAASGATGVPLAASGAAAVPAPWAAFDAKKLEKLVLQRIHQLYLTTSTELIPKQRTASSYLLKASLKLSQLQEQASDYTITVMDAQKAQCAEMLTGVTDGAGDGLENRMNKLLRRRQPGQTVVHSPT